MFRGHTKMGHPTIGGREHIHLMIVPVDGRTRATYAGDSCRPGPLTSRSAATISSRTAETIIARKSLSISDKPRPRESVPAG